MRRLRTILAIACLAMLMPGSARADYKRSFKDAVRALDRRQWADLERLIREAISDNPTPGEGILVYGNRQETYLPHFYLGLALFHQNRCAEAIVAWRESTRHGAVTTHREFSDLQRFSKECDDAIGLSVALEAARNDLRSAEDALRQLELEKSKRPEAWSSSAEFAQSFQSHESELQDARKQLEQADAQANVDMIKAAGAKASRIPGAVETARSRLAEWNPPKPPIKKPAEPEEKRTTPLPPVPEVPQPDPEIERVRKRIRETADSATSMLRSYQRVSSPPADLRNEKARLDTTLGRAKRVESIEDRSALEQLETDLRQSTQAFSRLVNDALRKTQNEGVQLPPPDALVRLAQTYFDRDYRKVLEDLELLNFGDPRARSYALLFESAATWSLYRLDGSRSESLLEQAASAARTCRNLNPDITLNNRDFSPSFVAFFEGQ